jgi:hypothetical protein
MMQQKSLMDNNGQFLLYDMLLAFIILLLVIVSATYLTETNDISKTKTDTHIEGEYLLELLEDEGLLTKLSTSLDRNDSIKTNKTLERIDCILSTNTKYKYSLTDETTNKTLIDHTPHNHKEVCCFRKMLNNHEFALTSYP